MPGTCDDRGRTWSRRSLIAAGGAAVGLGLSGPATARPGTWSRASRHAGFDRRHLTVQQYGRAEAAQIRFRTRDGIPDMPGVNALSWLFRDWRDHDMGLGMDIRLFDVLATIQTILTVVEDRPVRLTLYSGYRTPERNRTLEGAAPYSQHIYGRAADIAAEGVSRRLIVQAGEIAGAHGIGLYPLFTHIDVGPRGRRWRG